MKKLTLLQTFLHEKDNHEKNDHEKVNKELGNFKSLLHGDSKNNPPKNDIDKELDSAKWELSEGFGLESEKPFDDAVNAAQKERQFNVEPENAFSDAFDNHKEMKEEVIGIDQMDPMDELEHVSLVIHPVDVTNQVDPLMTPMGGCDSEDASVSTFAAPGGPDFEKPKGNETILIDGGEVKNEAAWTFSPDDVGFEDHFREETEDDESDFFGNGMENDDWLQYIMEPEEEKHNVSSNDLKGLVGPQGTKSTSVTSPTIPTKPTKECSLETTMMPVKENVKNLRNKISEVKNSLSRDEKISENVNKIKNILKNIK